MPGWKNGAAGAPAVQEYNDTLETDAEKRKAIMAELLPDCGEGTFLQGPLQFDYGCYTKFGKRCYANFNLVVLDVCPVVRGRRIYRTELLLCLSHARLSPGGVI
ncbi:MAG: maltose acetyltransferase domain-containing protein [Ruminococcus callidus]